MTGEHGWFADRSVQRTVTVLENLSIARETYRIRIVCPEIARQVTPGQFLMLRLRSGEDPLLGRPFALYDTVFDRDGRPEAIDLVYQVVGRVTRRLAALSVGDRLEVWGPLGNGFPPQDCQQLVMVAGGIGQTPFLALAREHLHGRVYGDPPRSVPHVPSVVLCYGARSGASSRGGGGLRKAGRRRADSNRRWFRWRTRSGDRISTAVARGTTDGHPSDCLLWAGGHDGGGRRAGTAIRRSGAGFTGNTDGLRDRDLLHVCRFRAG